MEALQKYGWMLGEGVELTLLVGLNAYVLAILLGLLGAWGKLSRSRFANSVTGTYTTVVRGVPEIVLLLLIYYGAPTLVQDLALTAGHQISVDINPFVTGIATIGFIYGAFATEIFRGAYLAVPRGQGEACRSLGLSRWQAFRHVVLPQMLRYALPALGNLWLVLIKATALISIIQLPELMRNADIAARATRLPFTFYFAASLLYLAITLVSMWLQGRLEGWANRGLQRA